MSIYQITLYNFFLISFSFSSIYFGYYYTKYNEFPLIYNYTANIIEKCFIITAYVVDSLVHDYFYTFRYCWTVILITLDSLITNYFIFLAYMIRHMLVYPTVLILGITSSILLWIVRLIIKDIFLLKLKIIKQ